MATSHEGQCAKCQTLTRKYCSRCVLPLGRQAQRTTTPLTFYCSTECQKSDYGSHKYTCIGRQHLFRGGKLLQEALFVFRETAFDLDIYVIKRVGDELHFYVPEYNENKGPLYTFPEHLVPIPADKEALLAYSACTDALKHIHPLIVKVLEDVISSTTGPQEITFTYAKSDLKVFRHTDGVTVDENNLFHQVLDVTLVDGERYAIDLAGAQHRQYQAVVPWNAYTKRMKNVIECNKFGFEATRDALQGTTRLGKEHPLMKNGGGFDTRIYGVRAELAKAFKKGVDLWQPNTGKSVVDILHYRKTETFEAEMEYLLMRCKWHMMMLLDQWEKKGGPRFLEVALDSPELTSARAQQQDQENVSSDGSGNDDPASNERSRSSTTEPSESPEEKFKRLLMENGPLDLTR